MVFLSLLPQRDECDQLGSVEVDSDSGGRHVFLVAFHRVIEFTHLLFFFNLRPLLYCINDFLWFTTFWHFHAHKVVPRAEFNSRMRSQYHLRSTPFSNCAVLHMELSEDGWVLIIAPEGVAAAIHVCDTLRTTQLVQLMKQLGSVGFTFREIQRLHRCFEHRPVLIRCSGRGLRHPYRFPLEHVSALPRLSSSVFFFQPQLPPRVHIERLHELSGGIKRGDTHTKLRHCSLSPPAGDFKELLHDLLCPLSMTRINRMQAPKLADEMAVVRGQVKLGEPEIAS
jgi:hypothetical protein